MLFPAILIPAFDSSSLAFYMMYSVHNLNKQNDNIPPCHIPFPILSQSVVPRPVLTVASWPTYRFLRRQVTRLGIPICLRIFHSFFVIHTVHGFCVVNEDAFLKHFAFSMTQQILTIRSPVPLPLWNLVCQSGIYQFKYCWNLAWRILIIPFIDHSLVMTKDLV